MIIGYDAKRITHNSTGLGNYGRTLINDMSRLVDGRHTLRLYTPDAGKEHLRGSVEGLPSTVIVTPKKARSGLARALWRSAGVSREAASDGCTLFHGLSGELPAGLRQRGIRSVVTIHDLIFLRFPQFYNRIDVAIYKAKFHQACRRADHIIAISERTKADIIAFGGVSPEKISVVYQSCSPRFADSVSEQTQAEVRERLSLPRRFVLNVGTIEERKNVIEAVEALPLLPRDISLVVVGRRTEYTKRVEEAARRHAVAHRVHILSGVSTADLAVVYSLAEVFVYPSRYEGFGLPVIEAIQAGLPVVAATGSCLEEAGGKDSLYVDPDAPTALADAVRQVLRSSAVRQSRIARSRDYVRRFENTATARRTLDIYEQIVADETI